MVNPLLQKALQDAIREMREQDEMRKSMPSFSVSDTAWILGVSIQAVSGAIHEGRLKAEGSPRSWRIPVTELIRYALRSGWPPEALAKRLEETTKESPKTIAYWILETFGIKI